MEKRSNSLVGILTKVKKTEQGVLNFLTGHPKELTIAMMGLASLPVISLGWELKMVYLSVLAPLAISLYLPDKQKTSLK